MMCPAAIRVTPLGAVILAAVGLFMFLLYGVFLPDGQSSTTSSSDGVSLRRLLSVSVAAAESGGREAVHIRHGTDVAVSSKGKTKEGANDPLTAGDLASHRQMLSRLLTAFPKLKIISEEHGSVTPDDGISAAIQTDIGIDGDVSVPLEDVTVWVDPLDATQEYTENTEELLAYVTTMVCVVVRGQPVIGVIHQPFRRQTYWAWVGHGTSPGLGVAIEPPEDKVKQNPTIIVSRSHAGKVKDVAVKAFGSGSQVISAGGAGYKTLQVVQGKANAYIHTTAIKKWDICAGHALLNAVGGQMTTLNGLPLSYGDQDDAKNEDGILATLYHHSMFLEKLKNVKS